MHWKKNSREKKFDLLDEMRELNIGNKIPITLSMGISATGESLAQSQINAKAAIDIALGRGGGDQAVLNKKKEPLTFMVENLKL